MQIHPKLLQNRGLVKETVGYYRVLRLAVYTVSRL